MTLKKHSFSFGILNKECCIFIALLFEWIGRAWKPRQGVLDSSLAGNGVYLHAMHKAV